MPLLISGFPKLFRMPCGTSIGIYGNESIIPQELCFFQADVSVIYRISEPERHWFVILGRERMYLREGKESGIH